MANERLSSFKLSAAPRSPQGGSGGIGSPLSPALPRSVSNASLVGRGETRPLKHVRSNASLPPVSDDLMRRPSMQRVSSQATVGSCDAGVPPAVPEEEVEAPATEMDGTVAQLLDGENDYPVVCGVLGVKVVSSQIRTEGKAEGDVDAFTFVRLRIRNITKYTDSARRWGNKLIWGEITYFPIRVIRDPRHPFNLFQIDVFSVPHHVPFAGAVQSSSYILGSVPFHVHDLVKGSPSSGCFTILKNHRPVGNITLEFYFTYGSFGYGYSPQFKDSEEAEAKVQFSMLPRSIPPARSREPWSQTLITPTSRPDASILDPDAQGAAYPNISARMKRLRGLQTQFDSIDSRKRLERLAFLYKQINGTSTKQSMSTPPVFVPRDQHVSRSAGFFQSYMRPTLPPEERQPGGTPRQRRGSISTRMSTGSSAPDRGSVS